jgi:Tfp pilus assembly protein PilP
MKSFTCHNIYSYCLAVLVCFFLSTLVGCDEKVTPPAKPSVVKKRIEQDKTETVAKVVVEEEIKKASTPSSELTSKTKPVLGEGSTPGTETAVAETAPSENVALVPDEKVVSAKDEKGQAKAQKLPGVETEKSLATDGPAEEKPSSLKASIPDESWQYNPKGKINPFAALFKEGGDVGLKKKSKLTRPLTPLEKIDLSQLKLVAVLRTESKNKAMVEDATGKGYVISIGTRMGTHSGKVVKILKDRVFIEEETEDFLGRIKKAEREIRLQKPSGEE